MRKLGKKIRVLNDSILGKDTRVWIDDVEMTDQVRSMTFSWACDEANTFTVEFYANDVEVEARAVGEMTQGGESRPCPDCGGAGEIPREDGPGSCERCAGSGTHYPAHNEGPPRGF